MLLTDDNGETSTNFRFGQTIRVFISLLISFLLCAWFYFRADTSFATVDPSQQKVNISIVGQKICFGNAKKVGEIIILLVVKKNERKNNRT